MIRILLMCRIFLLSNNLTFVEYVMFPPDTSKNDTARQLRMYGSLGLSDCNQLQTIVPFTFTFAEKE